MDMPMQVPVDDPNADTEWNHILRKHKIIPEKPPSPTPMIQEALLEARRLAHENRLEGKTVDELDELEDEEDDEFLAQYRNQRFAELNTISTTSIFNQVYPLQKPDYGREVTEASKKAFVLVLLTSSLGTNIESAVMTELWRDLARRFGDIKFCQMRADLCIEGYPERNTPTILIYKDGDIRRQLVTLKEMRGDKTSSDDVEKLLLDLGALRHNDVRLRRRPGDQDQQAASGGIRRGRNAAAGAEEDDESDLDI